MLILLGCSFGNTTMKARTPDYYFDTPQLQVAQAIATKQTQMIVELGRGIDLDSPGRDGMTLLFFALQHAIGENAEGLKAVSELVKAGANPFKKSGEFGSPIGIALGSSSPAFARAFLDGGVDPNSLISTEPMIHVVARHHTFDTLKLLVERGADVNSRDSLNRSTMDRAFSNQQFDVVDYLLDQGADPNTFDVLGVSFAYSIKFALEREQAGTAAYNKMAEIRDRIIAMGVQWPPLDPPAMRDWMRSQGMKVVVPAGHER